MVVVNSGKISGHLQSNRCDPRELKGSGEMLKNYIRMLYISYASVFKLKTQVLFAQVLELR